MVIFKKITDQDFIGNLIPQKAPFVMVDKLIHFEENQVIAGLTITENNIFTQNNRFTAPGLIEHMAQTVALYTGYQYYLRKESAPVGYIGAIKKAEIIELPEVNKELTTTVNILHDIMDVTLVTAETTCDGKIIASSEMKTVLAQK
jgi:3-hydroxymyristoyl/3-hydroxydecanoyl-(acyl carrier protein) dehydratase